MSEDPPGTQGGFGEGSRGLWRPPHQARRLREGRGAQAPTPTPPPPPPPPGAHFKGPVLLGWSWSSSRGRKGPQWCLGSLPPASPLLQHRGRGSGLKMRCRALLIHHQPAPFLSTGAPPRSQTPEVVAFRSPRPDTAASSRGHCKAGSKFPTPRSLSVEPLGSARPPEAQLRTEVAG